MIYTLPTPQVAQLTLSHLLDALRRESFFVHALDHGNRLYQVRKNAMVIGITFEKNRIAFEADATETGFIKTAMLEVVAEMEDTLQALRHPLDTAGILQQDNLLSHKNRQAAVEKIAKYVKPETVTTNLKATTKDAVIAELLDLLVSAGHVTDRQTALDALIKRELAMSTGLKDGLACPHGRTTAVRNLVCAVGVKPEGMDFQSMDGKPSRIFTLVLCSEEATAPYLEFMAGLREALDERGREAVLSAKTNADLYRALTYKRSDP